MSGILTLNAGSSSLKFGLYHDGPDPVEWVSGQVDGIGNTARLAITVSGATTSRPIDAPSPTIALEHVMAALAPHAGAADIAGVGHRIVHGGPNFNHPMVLTDDVLNALVQYEPLAPLHQPHNLAGVALAKAAFPQAVQVGCFDTSFHRGHPWVNDTFGLPRDLYAQGIRRYGFHGLSYDYITQVIEQEFPELHQGRIIVAHLGNGASMCAIRAGKSVGSSMGFSALDGLPMGTRCGQIGPGVVLYLIDQKGMRPRDVMHMLYRESGLLGLSGLTSDMRELLASDKAEAAQAIEYYVFRARREIGAMAAVLGGLDGLVFCGGIGENAAPIRERIADGLGFLGITVDTVRNQNNARSIATGPTQVLVIPTDEERVIARAVRRAMT